MNSSWLLIELENGHRNSWFTQLENGDVPVRYIMLVCQRAIHGILWDATRELCDEDFTHRIMVEPPASQFLTELGAMAQSKVRSSFPMTNGDFPLHCLATFTRG